ncbi:MAG: hypothetical protein HRT35_29675 [Algicola sp.]|nr:hypothetical protein [Algicola sp.]
MNRTTAIERLNHWDKQGRFIFLIEDLAKIFPEDNATALKDGLSRLTKAGIFVRPTKGVYLYAYANSKDGYVIEHIAKALRRGFYSYVSLESSLSEAGVISQILIDRLTLMTTGRSGIYRTPYGVIEFTHTKRGVADVLKSTYKASRPLRVAYNNTAWRDLKRVGRNLHLVNEDELNEQSS